MPLSSLIRKKRPALNKPTTPEAGASQLFKILNTSLGTWMLSALFLTLGPFIWQVLDSHFKKEAAIEAESYRRARLVEEFSYRLSVTYSRLNSLYLVTTESQPGPTNRENIDWAVSPLLTVSDSAIPLFRENRDLSGISILAEIQISLATADKSDEPIQQAKIRHLRQRIDALSKISSQLRVKPQATKSPRDLVQYLRDEIDYKLWGDTGYSFLASPTTHD
jgi:hypothetical protein